MIRERKPDKYKAQSMIEAATIDITFLETLRPSKETAQTIVRGVYENFRILGEALLLIRGKEATGIDHHTDMIDELFRITVKTIRPVQAIINLKHIRNKVNYDGYLPRIEEVIDSLSMIETLFKPLYEAIKKEIERK